MSYDLMVFEPTAAPKEREAFLEWYEKQTEWSENHSYNDPRVCSPSLQRWFEDMSKTFPPMSGPFASTDHDNPRVTDYCCGRNVIYCAFSSSVASEAYEKTRELALVHKVGFFAASESPSELLFSES